MNRETMSPFVKKAYGMTLLSMFVASTAAAAATNPYFYRVPFLPKKNVVPPITQPENPSPGDGTGTDEPEAPATAGACLSLRGAYAQSSTENFLQGGYISRNLVNSNYLFQYGGISLVYKNRCSQELTLSADSLQFTASAGAERNAYLGNYAPGYQSDNSGGRVNIDYGGSVSATSSDFIVINLNVDTSSRSSYREPSNQAGTDFSWLYRLNVSVDTSVDGAKTWQNQAVTARFNPLAVRRLKVTPGNSHSMLDFTIPERSGSGVSVEVVNASDDSSFTVTKVASSASGSIAIANEHLKGARYCQGAVLAAGQSCKFFEKATIANAGQGDVEFPSTISVATTAGSSQYERAYVVLQPRVRGYDADHVDVLAGRGDYMGESSDVDYFYISRVTNTTGIASTCALGVPSNLCRITLTPPTATDSVPTTLRYYGHPNTRVDGVFTGEYGPEVFLGGDNLIWAYYNGSRWLVHNQSPVSP